jgi:hypothetical protein
MPYTRKFDLKECLYPSRGKTMIVGKSKLHIRILYQKIHSDNLYVLQLHLQILRNSLTLEKIITEHNCNL